VASTTVGQQTARANAPFLFFPKSKSKKSSNFRGHNTNFRNATCPVVMLFLNANHIGGVRCRGQAFTNFTN
jgi:hypothetical protein